jgi:hypothetical protein
MKEQITKEKALELIENKLSSFEEIPMVLKVEEQKEIIPNEHNQYLRRRASISILEELKQAIMNHTQEIEKTEQTQVHSNKRCVISTAPSLLQEVEELEVCKIIRSEDKS